MSELEKLLDELAGPEKRERKATWRDRRKARQ